MGQGKDTVSQLEPPEKRILVVDDEEVVRDVCIRSLQGQGVDLAAAENGARAREMMRERDFDLVLTDLKMPLIDGLELLGEIKRDHQYCEVVVMSAYATIENAIEALKNGAHDFILKPINPDELRMVAARCLEKIKLSQENSALRAANKKLHDLKKMKNKFIAITNHELRTPISHLKGYIDFLIGDHDYSLSESERQQCKDVISSAVDDLEEVVSRMHEHIHLESGRVQPHLEPLELNRFVSDIVKDHSGMIRSRMQSVDMALSNRELCVSADRLQMKGVFWELLQNAHKYTPDGGALHVNTSVEQGFGIVTVSDSGIGIAEDEIAKIFEPFYEVQDSNYHSTSKSNFMGGGLGLGLATARLIVEAHGGFVKVASTKGRGSAFKVYLPLCDSKPG